MFKDARSRQRLVGLVIAASSSLALWRCASDFVPPPMPNASASQNSSVTTFAVDHLFFGDRSSDGGLSYSGWKRLGYDLDGKQTSKSSTDVCAAAIRTNQVDGQGGIDNAFGGTIV